MRRPPARRIGRSAEIAVRALLIRRDRAATPEQIVHPWPTSTTGRRVLWPVVAVGRGGRYGVGVEAVGVPSGKPGDPTPIRVPVTGGAPAVRIWSTIAPPASRIVIVPCAWSSNSDNPSSLTTG